MDLNNFDLDYAVLVNLNASYQLVGMWRMTRETAKAIFTWRGEKYRKYQTTQSQFKSNAERIV